MINLYIFTLYIMYSYSSSAEPLETASITTLRGFWEAGRIENWRNLRYLRRKGTCTAAAACGTAFRKASYGLRSMIHHGILKEIRASRCKPLNKPRKSGHLHAKMAHLWS